MPPARISYSVWGASRLKVKLRRLQEGEMKKTVKELATNKCVKVGQKDRLYEAIEKIAWVLR